MRKVHRHVPDVPQKVADRGTDIVERCLSAYGVSRATDLPEEGKVRLAREMQAFFREELPPELQVPPPEPGWRGAAQRTWLCVKQFFSRRG